MNCHLNVQNDLSHVFLVSSIQEHLFILILFQTRLFVLIFSVAYV